MITIVVIFCQLAFSYVHCGPVEKGESSHPSQLSRTDIETWSLKEVWIRTEQTQEALEHYTDRVRLFRYDNAFRIDELKAGSEESHEDRKVIACFKDKDFYAYLDDTIYVILPHSHEVIRMTLAKKSEALSLQSYLVPSTFEKVNSERVLVKSFSKIEI